MSKKSRAQRARERPCPICFGSHGCKKQEGHTGQHYCGCGMSAEGFEWFMVIRPYPAPGEPDIRNPNWVDPGPDLRMTEEARALLARTDTHPT